jgi:hypothetical protein
MRETLDYIKTTKPSRNTKTTPDFELLEALLKKE